MDGMTASASVATGYGADAEGVGVPSEHACVEGAGSDLGTREERAWAVAQVVVFTWTVVCSGQSGQQA